MSIVLFRADVYQVGTVVSLLLTALTGLAVYIANSRARRGDKKLSESSRQADLVQAEVAGWKSLIQTLTNQYDLSQKEAADLSAQLRLGHELAMKVEKANARDIADLEEKVATLTADNKQLKSEITRLRAKSGS